jgi:hypothetical protein
MTAEDKRAQIDRRFDETFAVFDERMRKEQEAISQDRAARGGGSGPAGGAAAGEETGDGQSAGGDEGDGMPGEGPGGEGGEGGDGGDVGDGSDPGSRGESAGGRSGEQGGGGGVGGGGPLGGGGPNTVPADIPDGRDDDIVARQLREAAMKETDPELRERLWEEYRQYKQSTR